MAIIILRRLGALLVFALLQALVFGRIHLFGVATPLFFVYFVTQFERNYPKWGILLWSFALGMIIDIFLNTPGLTATSLTLFAFAQPYYYELFIPRDSADNLRPSMSTLGWVRYCYYIIPFVVLYCAVFFALEFFNMADLLQWGFCVVGSATLTLVLIFVFETIKGDKK